MSERAKRICKLGSGLVLVALVVTSAVLVVGTATAPRVEAWATPPCDFLTGGGWIVHNGAKANFGVGGGCKHGSPTWGHLEYIDHGTGLNVHWTSITEYQFIDDGTGTDPKTHQPTGTRKICGTARTNQFGDVNFAVRAKDARTRGQRPVRHPVDEFGRRSRLHDHHGVLSALFGFVCSMRAWRRWGRKHPAP